MGSDTGYILEMNHITKEFPGVKALKDVTFKVRKGVVHGLMGENGAGKSTLMKILQGIYTPTSGTMIFDGKPLELKTIYHALEAGISMIHQEMSPIPDMTVAENIFLGREPKNKWGFVDHKQLNEMTARLLGRLRLKLSSTILMRELSVGNMQMVEIAKAISFHSKLIIMDEPTSAIADKEVESLFNIIRMLKEEGVTIIYITHKMSEVFEITDEISVLRDGELVGGDLTADLDNNKLISLMVGRELTEMFPKVYYEPGEELLRVEHFSDGKRFFDVSFCVHEREMLGFTGLIGSGRSELLEAVFGLRPHTEGRVFIRGKEVHIRNPHDAIALGIGLLTEDRKASGCFLPLDITDNMIMSNLELQKKGMFLDFNRIKAHTESMRAKLAVKTPSMEQHIELLSGGNQQKVLMGRWMINAPLILIVDEPTRGIDVNAKAEIHRLLGEMNKNGTAVILVSSEMPEVLGMSDRIVIMHEGRKAGEIGREDATQELLMQIAFGEDEGRKH